MHLVFFVAMQFGVESRVALLVFLVLKTLVDLAMHILQHISFKEPENQQNHKQGKNSLMSPGDDKGRELSKKQVKQDQIKQRKTLKQRLKLWFLLAWIAFLLSVVIVVVVIKELNI